MERGPGVRLDDRVDVGLVPRVLQEHLEGAVVRLGGRHVDGTLAQGRVVQGSARSGL